MTYQSRNLVTHTLSCLFSSSYQKSTWNKQTVVRRCQFCLFVFSAYLLQLATGNMIAHTISDLHRVLLSWLQCYILLRNKYREFQDLCHQNITCIIREQSQPETASIRRRKNIPQQKDPIVQVELEHAFWYRRSASKSNLYSSCINVGVSICLVCWRSTRHFVFAACSVDDSLATHITNRRLDFNKQAVKWTLTTNLRRPLSRLQETNKLQIFFWKRRRGTRGTTKSERH